MGINITGTMLAALRAQLVGEHQEHRRLLGQLFTSEDFAAYTTLVNSAFMLAAKRRFPPGTDPGEVAAFVNDVRSRTLRLAGGNFDLSSEIEPRLAKRAIMYAAFGGPDTNDLEPKAVLQTELLLLQCLIDYQQLSDDELDVFLRQARDHVSDWSRRYRDRSPE